MNTYSLKLLIIVIFINFHYLRKNRSKILFLYFKCVVLDKIVAKHNKISMFIK